MLPAGHEALPLLPLGTALGVGLLVGAVRERRHPDRPTAAGLRTHALAALAGAVSLWLDPAAFAVVLGTLTVAAPFGWRAVGSTVERHAACREAASALGDMAAYRGDVDARMSEIRRGRTFLTPAAEARQDAALVVWFTRDAPDGRTHPAMRTASYTRSHVPEAQRRRAVEGARQRLTDYRAHYCTS